LAKNLLHAAHFSENVLQCILLYYNALQPIAVDSVDFFKFLSRARETHERRRGDLTGRPFCVVCNFAVTASSAGD
jgi:hypothetical protein